MNQEIAQPKKRMSTGCLVALIIVGVLVVMIIIAGVFAYLKCDDIAGYGAVMVAQEIKRSVETDPQPGVDTVRVNGALDAFIARTQATEEPDLQLIGGFMQSIQPVLSDKIVDSIEAEQIVQAVYRTYPDLEPVGTEEAAPPLDSIAPDTADPETVDSLSVE